MMYYSTGCAHAPHHVAKQWADKYKGSSTTAGTRSVERVFARQKELGVIPQDAELTERPDIFPAWDSLTDAQKTALRAADGGVRRLLGERRLERGPAA